MGKRREREGREKEFQGKSGGRIGKMEDNNEKGGK